MPVVETDRLILRRWQRSDREPFARLNADARVMEFMPALLSRDESDRMADRIEEHFREHGFGLCAAELRQDHSFIGFVGLSVPAFQAVHTQRGGWLAAIGRSLGAGSGHRRRTGDDRLRF